MKLSNEAIAVWNETFSEIFHHNARLTEDSAEFLTKFMEFLYSNAALVHSNDILTVYSGSISFWIINLSGLNATLADAVSDIHFEVSSKDAACNGFEDYRQSAEFIRLRSVRSF